MREWSRACRRTAAATSAARNAIAGGGAALASPPADSTRPAARPDRAADHPPHRAGRHAQQAEAEPGPAGRRLVQHVEPGEGKGDRVRRAAHLPDGVYVPGLPQLRRRVLRRLRAIGAGLSHLREQLRRYVRLRHAPLRLRLCGNLRADGVRRVSLLPVTLRTRGGRSPPERRGPFNRHTESGKRPVSRRVSRETPLLTLREAMFGSRPIHRLFKRIWCQTPRPVSRASSVWKWCVPTSRRGEYLPRW